MPIGLADVQATGTVQSITIVGAPVGPASAEIVVDLDLKRPDGQFTAFRIGAGTAPQVFTAMTNILCLAVTLKKPVTVVYTPSTQTPTITEIVITP